MKHLFLTISFGLLLSSVEAQVLQFNPDSKQMQSMLTRTVQIVETGNEEYNKAIRSAVETYWKATPYEFISGEQLKKNIPDESKTFLIPLNISLSYQLKSGGMTHDKTKFWYALINGGKKSVESYSDNDVLVLSPIGLYTGEEAFVNSAYRLDYIIKGLNDAVVRVKDGKVDGKYLQSLKPINDGFVALAKTKTLVVNKDAHSVALGKDRGITVPEKVMESYPYKYKYVNDEEFREIMAGSDESYLCLLPVIEVNEHILVYQPSTKETVYYGFEMTGLEVKKGDVKSMAEGKD